MRGALERIRGEASSVAPFAAGVAAGALVRLGGEPHAFWPGLWLGMLPLCALWRRPSVARGAAAGLGLGLVYCAVLPLAALKWGPWAAVQLWLLPVSLFAGTFALAGAVGARVPPRARAFVPGLVWILSAHVLDHVYGSIVLVSPLMLRELGVAHWVGALGTSALALVPFVLPTALVALRDGCAPSAVAGALAVAVLAGGLLTRGPLGSPSGSAHLLALQPAITSDDYALAGSDLVSRLGIEERVDRLMHVASRRAPGTIVWPENGNGLPNAQLDRQVQRLRSLMADGRHDLLASGPEFDGDRQRLTITHIDATGVGESARKARTVPVAEADLEAGAPSVIETREGPIGIAICFDSIFGAHVRALSALGAEVLVVTSDESSFGLSALPAQHVEHTLARAMEAGRSVVFVMNRGPAMGYDAASGTVVRGSTFGQQAVASIRVARRTDTTLAMRGGRHVLPAIALVLLLALCARAPRADRVESERRAVLRRAPGFALVLAVGIAAAFSLEVAASARMYGVDPTEVLADVDGRLRRPRPRPGLGLLFRQSRDGRCGPAALAFGLTLLGDRVSEEELARALGHEREQASLEELRQLAAARGFDAGAYRAQSLEALRVPRYGLALIHLSREHFVVLWAGPEGRLQSFDPANGHIGTVSSEAVERLWTGHALVLQHRSMVARAADGSS